MARCGWVLLAWVVLGCGGDRSTPAVGAPMRTEAGTTTVPPGDEWAASDALKATLLPEVAPAERDGIASRVVKIERVPAPFLASAELYRCTRTARVGEEMVHHPWTWLMVRIPGDGLRMLGNDADVDRMRTKTKLALDTEAARLAYVRTVFEIRGREKRSYEWIADSVADLRLFTSASPSAMPRASDEAEAKRARDIEARLTPLVKPLALPGASAPWTGTLYALSRPHDILRVKVTLAADGALTLTDEVLETEAPVPGVFP